MFSIVAMEYFKLGPKENGIVLSYVGILSIVSILFRIFLVSYIEGYAVFTSFLIFLV